MTPEQLSELAFRVLTACSEPGITLVAQRNRLAAIKSALVEAEAAGAARSRQTIGLFLSVVRERLDCLKEHGYVEKCDALKILEENLDAALAECKAGESEQSA